MRRMITNKQVVDVVNKAIEEGEIQAGGYPEIQEGDAGKVLTVNAGETGVEWAEVDALPEIQEGDAGKLLAVNSGETGAEWVEDNNLKLPESAPATQQLVGINTSGAQNALGVGDGLTVDNGVLKQNEIYDLTASFAYSGSGTISLTTDEANYLKTNHPIIRVTFSGGEKVLFTFSYAGTNHYFTGTFYPNQTSGLGFLYKSSGTIQAPVIYKMQFEISGNLATYSKTSCTLLSESNGMLCIWQSALALSNVNSGDTITASNYKTLLQAGCAMRINGYMAYPTFIDSANIQYMSVKLDSTGFIYTIYDINRSTWVITFNTKTLA